MTPLQDMIRMALRDAAPYGILLIVAFAAIVGLLWYAGLL